MIGASFLLDVSLVMRRRNKRVMRMLDSQSRSRWLMRMVDRREIQALCRPKIVVLMMLMVTHRSVTVMKPDLLLLLLLLAIRMVHRRGQ